ncbi:MAG: hypothetical protein KJP10_03025, partial [Gammaproteobacteria bacterium]|nr:hypothetical protein [Gammaproteobacteria bacterium]
MNSAANINHSMAKIALEQRFFADAGEEFNAMAQGSQSNFRLRLVSKVRVGATSVANSAWIATEVA